MIVYESWAVLRNKWGEWVGALKEINSVGENTSLTVQNISFKTRGSDFPGSRALATSGLGWKL